MVHARGKGVNYRVSIRHLQTGAQIEGHPCFAHVDHLWHWYMLHGKNYNMVTSLVPGRVDGLDTSLKSSLSQFMSGMNTPSKVKRRSTHSSRSDLLTCPLLGGSSIFWTTDKIN